MFPGGCTVIFARSGLAVLSAWAIGAQAAPDPFQSTYRPAAAAPTLIRNATVLDGTGRRLDGADVLMRDGKVVAVGPGLAAEDATVVDAQGRWVTPGLIDVHSHLGVYARPGVSAHQDFNEMTDPVTSGVWAEHGVWPQDPGFATALAGGVTTLQVLPGSANLIGGRGVTLRNVRATTMQAMKFPDAPHGLKMACGENPKRVYGEKGRAPSTRMGNVAGYRQAFADAQDYRRQHEKYQRELAAHEAQASIRVMGTCMATGEAAGLAATADRGRGGIDWTLLAAVEMRGAPWLGWIQDLTTPDPWYILPIIMIATMWVQYKLNPTPPDPVQAKVFAVMPFIFGGMMIFFPSGLVLYWVVNNILSIAQQWQITRMIEGKPLFGRASPDA